MVSSGSPRTGMRTRFIPAPTLIIIIIGSISGILLGGVLNMLFSRTPQIANDGIWLLSFGIGHTITSYYGARMVKSALWPLLMFGQILAIAGLGLTGLGLFF